MHGQAVIAGTRVGAAGGMQLIVLPGGSRDVGRDDVGGVPVQGGPGPDLIALSSSGRRARQPAAAAMAAAACGSRLAGTPEDRRHTSEQHQPPLLHHFCSGVPSPPVQGAPYSGVYVGDARNLLTNCCSRGSAGELTFSWNPQDEMTMGEDSPG